MSLQDNDIEWPELPNGWEWWSGEVTPSSYTHWFGTEYRHGGDLVGVDDSIGGFDGELYHDSGGSHHVAIYAVTGERDDGDPVVSEYATERRTFDSKQEAVNAVPDMIQTLKERA